MQSKTNAIHKIKTIARATARWKVRVRRICQKGGGIVMKRTTSAGEDTNVNQKSKKDQGTGVDNGDVSSLLESNCGSIGPLDRAVEKKLLAPVDVMLDVECGRFRGLG
jgi:hypothetical protein